MTRPLRNRIISVLLGCAIIVSAPALSGCSLRSERLATANDPGGLFHVRYPGSWQSFVQPGLVALYAAEELPENEDAAFKTLSVGIYTASKAATEPVPARLRGLLELRAEDRAWRAHSISGPVDVTVGTRPATALDITGTDAKGRSFAGRAVLVRTNGREVLVFAVSPKATWERDAASLDDLLSEWYWHLPESEATRTAPAE